jgi:hypothetical protein
MNEFRAAPISYFDEEGGLVGLGAEWTELRHRTLLVLTMLFCLFGLAAVGVLFWIRSSDEFVPGIVVCLILSGFARLVWKIGKRVSNARRHLWFCADGTIDFPFKWGVDVPMSAIANIGSAKSELLTDRDGAWHYEVNLYTADGDTIRIAEKMLRAEAHKVTVLLTDALAEMRAVLGSTLHRHVEPDHGSGESASRVLID